MGRLHLTVRQPPPRRRLSVVLVAVALGGALPAAAHANLIAYTTVLAPAGDKDIAKVDTSTHAIARLGSTVNTGADESQPALSPDGTLIAYVRGTAGQAQTIMVTNPDTGATASVVDAFDVQALKPTGPGWTASGHLLLGIAAATQNGVIMDRLLDVDLTQFPNGPFPRTTRILGPAGSGDLSTSSVSEVQPLGANAPVDIALANTLGERPYVVSTHTSVPANSEDFEGHPTISAADAVVVFMSALQSAGPSRLKFTDLGSGGSLPSVVNAQGADEQMPAFSPDGRYLAFIRAANGQRRLLVFDTSTQLLLDTQGTQLDAPVTGSGSAFQRSVDGLAVREGDPVFVISSIFPSGLIRLQLRLPSLVGIIVQRVVGSTKLLGRTVPKLRFVGRVPLGNFHKGDSKLRWDLRVSGRRLPPGRYQVTPRSLTARAGIRDLGKPVLITIARHAHH
jgi:hypothetical protein